VQILVARLLTVGLTLGLSSLASIAVSPLSAAQAAYSGWTGYVAQPKRPYFRPSTRADRRVPIGRWRPQSAPIGRASGYTRQRQAVGEGFRARQSQPVFTLTQRVPVRKATSTTGRAVQIGIRFRPDRRLPPVVPAGDQVESRYPAELHAQFRPMQPRRRPSYEEMQRQRYRTRYARPMMAGANRYGYWPAWR
jgi:hypothetical protein